MSEPGAAPDRISPLIGLLIVAVLLGLALSSDHLRALLGQAFGRVTPLAVLATLPGQIAALLLCAFALKALVPDTTYRVCFAARLLRDAGGGMPIFLPGIGEAIGTRALVLAGGKARASVSASALDMFAEAVAQVPYVALAGWLLWRGWDARPGWPDAPWSDAPWAAIAGVAAALVALAAVWQRFGKRTRLGGWLRGEWHKLATEARLQRGGLPLAVVLHLAAWVISGAQIWMAAQVLGFDLTLLEAVAVKSAADAGRTLFFFVPAGLVGQEAGLVAAGLAFGLDPAQSLAIGLAVRLRDVLLGGALLLWPLMEWRARGSARGRAADGSP